MNSKTLSLATLVSLAGSAAAFSGQMSASGYYANSNGQTVQDIYLVDYGTGSQYKTTFPGFNSCSGGLECYAWFTETTVGGYSFTSALWRTNDGCHNIDFLGALDAGHGYCCGSLPCNIKA